MFPARDITSPLIVRLLAFRTIRVMLARLGYFHPLMLEPELYVGEGLAFRHGRKVPLKSVVDI